MEKIPLELSAMVAWHEGWEANRVARSLAKMGHGTFSETDVGERLEWLRSQEIDVRRLLRELNSLAERTAWSARRREERRRRLRYCRQMMASFRMMN